jgi:hypothetical protein
VHRGVVSMAIEHCSQPLGRASSARIESLPPSCCSKGQLAFDVPLVSDVSVVLSLVWCTVVALHNGHGCCEYKMHHQWFRCRSLLEADIEASRLCDGRRITSAGLEIEHNAGRMLGHRVKR